MLKERARARENFSNLFIKKGNPSASFHKLQLKRNLIISTAAAREDETAAAKRNFINTKSLGYFNFKRAPSIEVVEEESRKFSNLKKRLNCSGFFCYPLVSEPVLHQFPRVLIKCWKFTMRRTFAENFTLYIETKLSRYLSWMLAKKRLFPPTFSAILKVNAPLL